MLSARLSVHGATNCDKLSGSDKLSEVLKWLPPESNALAWVVSLSVASLPPGFLRSQFSEPTRLIPPATNEQGSHIYACPSGRIAGTLAWSACSRPSSTRGTGPRPRHQADALREEMAMASPLKVPPGDAGALVTGGRQVLWSQASCRFTRL